MRSRLEPPSASSISSLSRLRCSDACALALSTGPSSTARLSSVRGSMVPVAIDPPRVRTASGTTLAAGVTATHLLICYLGGRPCRSRCGAARAAQPGRSLAASRRRSAAAYGRATGPGKAVAGHDVRGQLGDDAVGAGHGALGYGPVLEQHGLDFSQFQPMPPAAAGAPPDATPRHQPRRKSGSWPANGAPASRRSRSNQRRGRAGPWPANDAAGSRRASAPESPPAVTRCPRPAQRCCR